MASPSAVEQTASPAESTTPRESAGIDERVLADVIRIKETLEKEGVKDDSEKILALLGELDEISITKTILSKSMIGKSINNLTSNASLENTAKEKAKALVEKWKRSVAASKPKAKAAPAAAAQSSTTTIASGESASTGTSAALLSKTTSLGTNVSSQASVSSAISWDSNLQEKYDQNMANSTSSLKRAPSEQNSIIADDSNAAKRARPNNVVRAAGASSSTRSDGQYLDKRMATRVKLEAALTYDAGDPEGEVLEKAKEGDDDAGELRSVPDLAAEIEQALFNEFQETKEYAYQIRSILSNLKDKKNPDFKRKTRLGILEPASFPKLTPADMASDDKNKEREKIREYEMLAIESDYAQKRLKVSSTLHCGKCKTTNCTYYQLQTRSSDEPMTTFVTCQTCGNRWKFC